MLLSSWRLVHIQISDFLFKKTCKDLIKHGSLEQHCQRNTLSISRLGHLLVSRYFTIENDRGCAPSYHVGFGWHDQSYSATSVSCMEGYQHRSTRSCLWSSLYCPPAIGAAQTSTSVERYSYTRACSFIEMPHCSLGIKRTTHGLLQDPNTWTCK
jgi:hypothetical protein